MPDLVRPSPHPPGATPAPPDATAVCDAYALGRPIGQPTFAARGELGRIWRMDTSAGTWAVKEIFRPGSEEDARADVAFQSAALAAGIPMPRPVVGRDGRVLATVPAGEDGASIRVYSWVELAEPARTASAGDAAAILGRLHALAYPDDGVPNTWFTDPVEPGRWRAILEAAAAVEPPWWATIEALVPDLVAGEPVIMAGRHTPTIRCHMDFNPQNVLVDTSGRAVVVDWENSGPESAEQELASALAEFVPDPSGVPDFLAAYRAAGGEATLRGRSSFAMTLAFQENLVAWNAERALGPAESEEDRARAAFWIEDIAANAFTLSRIDGWLAAVSGYDVARSSSHREDA
jgi:Ser/Thr protein kinase RdoA (MazF antagonist)